MRPDASQVRSFALETARAAGAVIAAHDTPVPQAAPRMKGLRDPVTEADVASSLAVREAPASDTAPSSTLPGPPSGPIAATPETATARTSPAAILRVILIAPSIDGRPGGRREPAPTVASVQLCGAPSDPLCGYAT